MKSGVDFTNVLRKTFTRADPKSTKKTDGLAIFFALLESSRIKAAHKMLMKLNSGFGETDLGSMPTFSPLFAPFTSFLQFSTHFWPKIMKKFLEIKISAITISGNTHWHMSTSVYKW